MTRQRVWIAVSAVLHVLFLAALLHTGHLRIAPARYPGTAEGTHLALVYNPGHASAAVSAPAIRPAETPLSRHLKLQPAPEKPASSAGPGPGASASQGNDALGSGNVTVALPTYFPWPHPDLSTLLPGTHGDVIVDVTIDQQGKITGMQVASSMGALIDGSVIAVIQTWTFKPATRDGVAVPSQQELLFHFEHA